MYTRRNLVVSTGLVLTIILGGCADLDDSDALGVSVAPLELVTTAPRDREPPATAPAWTAWPGQAVATTLLNSTRTCTEGDWLTKYITYRTGPR